MFRENIQIKNVTGESKLSDFICASCSLSLSPPDISDRLLEMGQHQRWRLSTSYRELGIVPQQDSSDYPLCVCLAKYF